MQIDVFLYAKMLRIFLRSDSKILLQSASSFSTYLRKSITMHRLRRILFSPELEGKVIYVLGIVTLTQFFFPITESGHPLSLLLYQIVYASMMVVGFVVARDNRRLISILIVSGIVWLGIGLMEPSLGKTSFMIAT